MVRVDFVSCPCCSEVVVTVDEDFKIRPFLVQGILPILDVLSIRPCFITYQEHCTNILSFPSGGESVMAGSDPQHSHTKC